MSVCFRGTKAQNRSRYRATWVDWFWNVMAHAHKTDFVFRQNGRVHLNRPEGASVQLTTGSRGVRISGSNAGYTMFRGSVKGTGYPLHSPVSSSLPLARVSVRHHISTGLYTHTWPWFSMGSLNPGKHPGTRQIKSLGGKKIFLPLPGFHPLADRRNLSAVLIWPPQIVFTLLYYSTYKTERFCHITATFAGSG